MEITFDPTSSLEDLEDFLPRIKSKSQTVWEETLGNPLGPNNVSASGQGGVRVDWGGKNGPVVSIEGSGRVNVGNGHVAADASHNTKTGEGHIFVSGGGKTDQNSPTK